METSNLFKGKKDEEKTSMQVTYGFLRMLEKFRGKRESYELCITRLLLSKDVSPEEKQLIKKIKHDYEGAL